MTREDRIVAWYEALRADLETIHACREEIAWANGVGPPADADTFAREAIYVICNSGMKAQVARAIYERVMADLREGLPSGGRFGHKLKCRAIDKIWREREQLFREYTAAHDKVMYLGWLPHIGEITKWHLAKNFGIQVAKPDRHLVRVAGILKTDPQGLCELIAARHEDKVTAVDLVIWRACNMGLIDSDGPALDEDKLLDRRRAWVLT